MNDNAADARSLRWLGALLVVLGGAGIFARLAGLGERPLAVDEYYFLTSVQAVLSDGLPALPGGGYYTRGLVPQYLTAGLAALVGDLPTAGRLFGVLCNVACAFALYLYARPFLGRELGLLPPLLLLVSSWEIEFARFARMYAPFQLVTVLFLWTLDRAFFAPDRRGGRYWPHALAAVANLTHALGLLLLPLLFVPLLLPPSLSPFTNRSKMLRYGAVTTAVLVLLVGFDQLNLAGPGAEDPFPAGYELAPFSFLRLPAFAFWSIHGHGVVNLAAFGIAVAASGALGWFAARRRKADPASAVVAGMTLASAVLHQFIPTGIGLALLVGRFRLTGAAARAANLRWLVGATALVGVGWLATALVTTGWRAALGDQAGSLVGALRRVFFGWPDLYQPVLVPWMRELPDVGLLVGVCCAFQLAVRLRAPATELLRNPATIVLYVSACFGVLNADYVTTRYAFFVYPAALVCVVRTAADLVAWVPAWVGPAARNRRLAATAGLSLVAFSITSDFQPSHWLRVKDDAVVFRLDEFERLAGAWYPRSDFATPALHVATNAAADEPVIVIGQPPVSFYLERDHAIYYDRGDPRFSNVSRARGTRDRWSAQRLISTPNDLRDYTAGAQRVWLVRDARAAEQPFRAEDVWGQRWRTTQRVFLGRDGRVEVATVELQPTR